MKLLSNKTLMIVLVFISGYGYIASCTHKDVIPPASATNNPVITHGDNVHLPGTMTAGDTTQWKLDKVHSSVLWSTNYVGLAGLLTGRFNQFGMHDVVAAEMINYNTTGQPLKDTSWAFYENDPAKTYFNGYVQINTSNTGEAARDQGCNIVGMGTVPIVSGVQNLTVRNLARIKATKVEFDPLTADYIVTLDLTWHGYDTSAQALANPITKSIVGKLKYIPRANVVDAVTGTTIYSVFGLQLSFEFNCRDYGIISTSISDKIDIECNMNFNNK
jgi:polyisoprenoid-binding protein YceI